MAAEVVGPEGADDAPARHSLRAFVREAVGTPTGPGLAAALEALMGRDDLSAREWVEVTSAWKKMECYCVAARMTAVAEVDRAKIGASEGRTAPGRDDPVRPAADELAPVLGIALRTASSLVGLTRRMDDFPAAMDALAEGRMDYAQVRVLDRVVRDLAPGAAAAVESAAVAWASGCTPQQLHADLATEAMRVDPEHAATAAARGVDERDVTWRISRTPGCARLVSDLPSISGAAGWMALNTAAKNARKVGVRADGRPEDRTVAQLRADILSSLLTGQQGAVGGSRTDAGRAGAAGRGAGGGGCRHPHRGRRPPGARSRDGPRRRGHRPPGVAAGAGASAGGGPAHGGAPARRPADAPPDPRPA